MDEQTVDVREVVGVLARHKIMIGAIVAAMTILATGLSLSQTKIYAASSKMILHPVVAPAAFATSTTRDSAGPLGLELSAESEAEIIGSTLVGARVKEALRLQFDASDLADSVAVVVRTDELLEITAFSTEPALAADLANAFPAEYVEYRRQTAADSIMGHATDLRNRLDDISSRVKKFDEQIIDLSAKLGAVGSGQDLSSSSAARVAELKAAVDRITTERNEMLTHMATLRQRLEDARNASTISTGGGEVIEPATVPTSASRPRPKRDGVLGLILGFVIAIGLAFLREQFDDRIRSGQDAIRATNIPVLAAIPPARKWTRRKDAHVAILADPGSAAAEAYRGLRQSLTAMGLGRTIRSILITSGGQKAGKTATAANLAVACVQAGLRVVVVSADLRRPRMHEFFGLDNEQGLSTVLSEGQDAREGLVPTAIAGLWVLPSGPAPRNPAGLLDGGHFDRVLRELLGVAHVVIIDGPPIASGADALVLAPKTDLTVLTMRCGSARTSGAAAGVGVLGQAGATRQVTVLNMATQKAGASYIADPGAYMPLPDALMGNGHKSESAVVPVANGSSGTSVAVPKTVNGSATPKKPSRGSKD